MPGSDKITASSLRFVRSHAWFRQNHGFPSSFCPKSYQVQTNLRLPLFVLSEVMPSSDKFTASPLRFVRSHTRFRQNHNFLSSFCPKSHQVQTKSQLPLFVLSEVTSSSDKFTASPLRFVRSHAWFRQNHGFLSSFCPKSHQVRTNSRLPLFVLSEVTPGSDKITASPIRFVRSHAWFRQSHSFSSSFCPKSHRVRTKSRLPLFVLSEVTPGSDKITASPLRFVRSHAWFRQNPNLLHLKLSEIKVNTLALFQATYNILLYPIPTHRKTTPIQEWLSFILL
jgi:hypothetical protein